MNAIVSVLFVVFIYFTNSQNLPPKVVFPPSELISNSNSSLKSGLRYGFQQTSECQIFEKAFLCIQKCKDLNYDTAYSDKYCFCTCYFKNWEGKYTSESLPTKTRWKLGAPTTAKPAWAQKNITVQDKVTPTSKSDGNEEVVAQEEKGSNVTITPKVSDEADVKISNETIVSNLTNTENSTTKMLQKNEAIIDQENVTIVENSTQLESTTFIANFTTSR